MTMRESMPLIQNSKDHKNSNSSDSSILGKKSTLDTSFSSNEKQVFVMHRQQRRQDNKKVTSHQQGEEIPPPADDHQDEQQTSIVHVINAMLLQRQLLLHRQAQELNNFLTHPTDRYTGPKEKTNRKRILQDNNNDDDDEEEGERLRVMKDLNMKLELLRKDLKKKQRIFSASTKH